MEHRRCVSNGVEVPFRVTGEADGRPTVLFLNGLGTTHIVWAPLVRALRDSQRLVLWDYPGLASGSPPPPRHFSVAWLAQQALAILDELGARQAHLVGWSLGVQVGFELGRDHADRISSLVAMCGVAGRPFEGLLPGQLWAGTVVPDALSWLSERSEGLDRLRSILSKVEGPSRWAKRLGLIDPAADDLLFDAVVREFVSLDVATYHRYLQAASVHDASDVAAAAPFPVLVLGGERDRFTQAARLTKLAESIPGAELFLLRGATHFAVLEHPDLVALKIRDFMERRT